MKPDYPLHTIELEILFAKISLFFKTDLSIGSNFRNPGNSYRILRRVHVFVLASTILLGIYFSYLMEFRKIMKVKNLTKISSPTADSVPNS